MGIEPLGIEEGTGPDRRFTEHRTVELAAPSEQSPTPGDAAESDQSVLDGAAETDAPSRAGIALGDKIVLVFSDDQKRISVRLSEVSNDLTKGHLAVGSPLGKLILGADEGDEVELALENGHRRKLLIESVEKGRTSLGALANPAT
jgi:transcription elongation GreA/GreB family factor